MTYKLGKRSISRLRGVSPRLVAVVMLAITLSKEDFSVNEGPRTLARQKKLKATGKSWTLKSRHLRTGKVEGYGVSHAVDLYPYVRGDSRAFLSVARCKRIVKAMMRAADILGVEVESGGLMWGKDWYHFQLSRKEP